MSLVKFVMVMKKTVDKQKKNEYNFIVSVSGNKNIDRLQQITEIKGGNYNGTTKKKMVKSKNTFKKINMENQEAQNLVDCPHCHEKVMQHRVCPNCGYYDGKEVVAKSEK